MNLGQRDMGTAVLTRMAQGMSLADIVTWLGTQSTQPESHPPGSSQYELLAGQSHWYQVYARMAAKRLAAFGGSSSDAMTKEATRLANIPLPTLTH